jgi:hypothetical protein
MQFSQEAVPYLAPRYVLGKQQVGPERLRQSIKLEYPSLQQKVFSQLSAVRITGTVSAIEITPENNNAGAREPYILDTRTIIPPTRGN